MFQSLAADVGIEFCLAKRTPSGGPTSGINRIQTTINEIGSFDSTVWQSVPLWDTTSYLNIYVCEILDAGFLLGYATYPGSPYNGLDGIVVDYRYFGTMGTVQAPLDKGKTLTHEVGHYLNLKHIWGDSSGCSDDDNVSDTPNQEWPNYGCNVHPLSSCGSDDMFMNYMDYGDAPCLVMFTQGQKMRMLAALNGPRVSLLTSTACQPFVASTIYVNQAATGANNGLTWADAYTDLNNALTAAVVPYSEIWVAQGTYRPSGATPTRDAYFNLPDSVRLYGGFDGTETTLNQRDPETNITILSGDLQGDDIAGDLDSNKTDNTLHVVWAGATVDHMTEINGFTIKGGYADIYDVDNTKRLGGGILSYGTPLIFNCIFEENYASEAGGLYLGTTGFHVENCAFFNNLGDWSSGAINTNGANGIIKDSYFSGNSAYFTGGAIEITDGEVDVDGCVFENNTSTFGGAISVFDFNYPTFANITNCDFLHNHAEVRGGAINSPNAPIDVMSCVFDGNTAGEEGGAIGVRNENYTITNSLIVNNTAGNLGLGGGIYVDGSSVATELTIINCTIANNHGAGADGIYQNYSTFAKVYIGNTILSNDNLNYAADITTAEVVSYQGNLSNDSTLIHVLTHIADKNGLDPMFADTANGDFHLQQGSPAQDIGITLIAPPFDLDSLPRISHSDAGAYEYPFFVSTEEPTISLTDDVKVYPNPPVDILTIEINNSWTGTVNFQLTDISGKIIKTWRTEKYGELHQEQISTQTLASGMYQILLGNEAGTYAVRFIKL